MLLPFVAVAQEPDSLAHRQDIIREARALKNIYKTDEAIELLSSLVRPESLDEDVFAELADCHFQNGDFEGAAGTYMLLSQKFPENILYQVRQMACLYRLKSYPHAASVGKAILRRDTITNVATMVGDSFNQMEQYDSALVYYGLSLRKKPFNESVVSKVAKIYLGRKDYDAVISVADSLLVLDPDNMTVAPIKGLALYGRGFYGRPDSWDNAIMHYKEAYRYNPKFISALSTIAYCYEQKKDYRTALEWYYKYLKVAKPGSNGYLFAQERVDYLKGELFMLE